MFGGAGAWRLFVSGGFGLRRTAQPAMFHRGALCSLQTRVS